MTSKRFSGALLMGAVLVPSLLVACSDDPLGSSALCCTEFKAGAAISADIGGSAQSKVAVQAVADFSGIASASIEDITTACRSIATDLDVPAADRDAAEQLGDRQARMEKYCDLAVSAIGTIKAKAGGTLKLVATPPVCQASISAKASCQASCSGSVKCDLKANPPKCTGGSLEVSCKGECKVKADAQPIKCEGTCAATCTGSCTVTTGSVKCNGVCNGTCKGNGKGGNGGIQADGTCTGECQGTCETVAPGATCEGSCQGTCSASCTGSATVAVKCDGDCQADFEPISCSGGKLEGGCTADAKCDANCDASVSARAECTPPSVSVEFTGSADVAAAGQLKATLEANLGVVLAFKSRLEGMASATGAFSANIGAVTDIKAVCIPAVVGAVGSALSDVKAAVSATANISGAVGAS